jgi:hypothetical protein
MTTATVPMTTTEDLTAPCPTCEAQPGEPCTTTSGAPVARHKRRPAATDDLDAIVAEIAEVEEAYRTLIEQRTEAMRKLNTADPKRYSTRKLAAITGVSFQRVSQLLSTRES